MFSEQKNIYDFLKESDKKIILYGMGNGADKVLRQLERNHIKIDGITASDDFVRGQIFHDFQIQKISEFEKKFEDFVVLTAFGSSVPEVMNHIFSLAEKYTVLSLDVPVYGENIFDSQFYQENLEDIQRASEIFADEKSREVFKNIIQFKLTGNLAFLKESYSEKEEAFRILNLSQKESFLDLGAYRGDTIEEFLKYTGGSYEHITALEPDRKTFAKLKKNISYLQNIRLYRMGIWSEDRDLYFNSALGRGSSLSEKGEEVLAVTKIDTLYARRRLSYLKMDVEGAEKQALLGGIQTIQRDKPKLNIAAYHRSEDLFYLPLLIHSIQPKYQIYLRQHPYIPAWDLNIYAI